MDIAEQIQKRAELLEKLKEVSSQERYNVFIDEINKNSILMEDDTQRIDHEINQIMTVDETLIKINQQKLFFYTKLNINLE